MAISPIFVAGTGTGVGKTHVTTMLIHALSRRGVAVLAAKPVETGVATVNELGSDIHRLASAAGTEPGMGNLYALRKPASPHLSARMEGRVIEPARILATLRSVFAGRDEAIFFIEGAGGLRVPLKEGYEMIDLARDLGAPILLVGRAGLGALNEVLLSQEAILRRGLPLLGTILNENEPGADPIILADNLVYLRAQGEGAVFGLLPFSAERLEDHVDLDALCAQVGLFGDGSHFARSRPL